MKTVLLLVMLILPVQICCGAGINDLVNGDGVKWNNREYRLGLAKSIHLVIEGYNKKIPNLSPDEKKWLETELQRIKSLNWENDAKQIDNFYDSVPFLLNTAKNGLNRIISVFDCINVNDIDIKKEMVCWTKLSIEIGYNPVWSSIHRLFQKDIISINTRDEDQFIVRSDLGPSYWSDGYSEGIIEYILFPYLVNESQ